VRNCRWRQAKATSHLQQARAQLDFSSFRSARAPDRLRQGSSAKLATVEDNCGWPADAAAGNLGRALNRDQQATRLNPYSLRCVKRLPELIARSCRPWLQDPVPQSSDLPDAASAEPLPGNSAGLWVFDAEKARAGTLRPMRISTTLGRDIRTHQAVVVPGQPFRTSWRDSPEWAIHLTSRACPVMDNNVRLAAERCHFDGVREQSLFWE